ncbi:uncharacterized protein LOC124315861 [Daphnia pulicaria]|uniref:uncharacterized protein LOC124315861 n=1 Tax=Daphnia pulicaria TaxID=35523 RepID=UPI001EEB48A6|nr:uncharacterized protein LOC124315861 [Daphnia pulicaria]
MGKHRTSTENKKDDICKSLSKMLHLVLWSVTDDEYLIEELILKDQQNRQEVERATASLESFIGHLFMANEIEKLDICRATVLVLKDGEDLSPWRLAFGKKQDQQLLVDKQIDIWQECVSEKKFHLPKMDSWKEKFQKKKISSNSKSAAAFVEVLLTTSSHSMLQLRLAVATQLLDQHMKPLEDKAMLERWSGLIATISTWSEVQTNEEITSRLVAVEICLIRHLAAFIGRWLKQKKVKKSIEFNFKEIINQLSVAANFLGRTEVQANLLVFGGLMHLAKTSSTDTVIDELNPLHFVAQYIQHLINSVSKKEATKIYGLKKQPIIQVLYSNDDKDQQQQEQVFTTLEKAYVERWLQTKTCFQSNDRIRDLYEKIQSVKKGRTKENRLFSSVGFELFTREEKRYIVIVGRDVAEELLRTQQPLSYMHVLKERAVQKIYQSFLKHFYPEQSTELLDRQPNTAEAQNPQSNEPMDPHDKQNCIDEFQRAFNRAHFFAKREGVEFEWLIWLQETVLRSIISTRDQVGLALVTEILLSSIEFTPEQLFSWTTMSRPHRWIDDALVNSIINATAQLKTKPPTRNAAGGNQLIDSLKSDLQCCLKSHQQKGRTVLKIFLRKLEQEAKLHSAGDHIDLLFVTRIVAEIKALQRIDDIGRFQETSLRQWMRLIRHARLADDWPSSLTDQLTTILDRRLGHDKTDRFLQRFNSKFCEILSGNASNERNHEKILDDMLKNLSKYPWIVDQFFALANEEVGQQDDHLWEFIQNRTLIEMDKENASKANLDANQIIDMMKNDIGSSAIVGGLHKQKKLIEQVREIKRLALEERKSWDNPKIKEWSENRKKVSKSVRLDPADFLSVAFLAVELKEKHHLRDAQLLAVLIFVSSANQQSGSQIGRRMAQISTGEGKTLITALLVVYHVLNNWSNGRRFVDIITSSSVLAEENVKEMQWFFDLFGIVVANNCDAACTGDESLRCKRYNSDVIYGDMSSFQRDILLSNFFSERKITGGRKTGAIVVDEVDSMLLDKGENILYLSHKIPEMDDLTQVFVEIWNAVHAPDVAMSDESAQAKVYRYMKLRLEEGEIAIPKCLDTYVHRHLLAWTRNAFRAKNLVTTKDSYKVDDVGDGRGQQIVIMDKETGVEQASMHWSQGLHQFIQLKHTLKLSPVSLKAIFMSNIGFFKQHEGAALYGMTGTLGSTAECQLLHDVFNVDFFKMPRFKRRFCLEEDPLLASSKGKWLTNIGEATQTQLDQGRAVLIVCENIAAAEAIYKKLLLQSDDKTKASKIVKYVSSFDTEFQTKQRNTALGPGDVIVATNLAGRGTDFKINEQLAKNGGLHVVIGYMPPNARVEAQIEGRVARAGQPGSFQFVLCHSSVKSKEDSISELLRLKVKRDDKECRRLETIRNRGLEKIYLEEKLFDRFHQEIYNKMKKEFADRPDCEMQMKFLTNRWALWLDENAEHINNVHLKKTDNVVEKNFQNFKKECQGLRLLPLAFALTPSELMLLGDFYETSPKVKTDVTKSGLCYDKVIKDEPNACEEALMRKVKLILQKATFDQKKEAKVLLKQVKSLIKQKMEFLTSTSELVKLTSQTNQKAGGAVPSENRFEEQITNQLSLLQIHLTAVEDILGRPVRQMLGMYFHKEEEFRELLNVIEAGAGLCTPYRLTKKINFFKTDNDDEAICIKINHQTQKKVKWPSCLDHCQTQTIHLFKAKHQKKSYAIEKKELESVIVTRDQLWETLIEEGFVGQEEMIEQQIICWANKEMDDESVKKLLDNLPKELIEYNGLLVNWLQSHEGEDYATAVGTLGLGPEHSSVLEEFLKTNKILLYVDERHGKLLKTLNFKSDTDLPAKLRKHYCLLSAWTLSVDGAQMEIDDDVSREDLPCPKDSREAVDQLWNYLIEQGVIKESKIVFSHGLRSDKDKIEERKNQIKTTLDTSLSSVIDDICRRHRPVPEPVTEVSYTDIPAYLADNKMSAITTAFESTNPFAMKELFNREKENMKKWLTEQQKKQHLDAYRAEVNMALEKSIGQLKTIPRVTASFQPLSKYFMSDPNTKRFPAEEIQSFQDKTFDGVITLKAVKSWGDYWDWRVFFVAMFAVAQISAGAAVIALSGGTMSVLGGALIAEGVGDMLFAIQNGVSGSFSWSSYGSHKLWSVGVTIATAGLSSYLTKGAIAGKAAMTGFQGRAGLSLFFAAAKKGLAKCGKAILSYLTSLGVDKFLTWLKTFIIENIIVHIKFLISKLLYPMFDTLAAKLEKIWALMKKLGRQVGEAIGLINADLDKASTSELYTIWGKRVVGQVTSLTSSIGGCFAESGDVWKAQGTEEFKANDAVGINSKKTSFKFVEYAKKATTVVKYLKNGAEILGLVSYAPEYVNNVNQTLDAKIRKLEDEIEIEEEKKKSTAAVQYHQIITSDSESFESEDEVESDDDDATESTMLSTAATERSTFNQFKEKVKGRVEGDISKFMVDSVTRAWVQPWLQSKIEGMVEHYGKKTFQAIGSMWQGSGTINSADQGNNKGDQQTASAENAEADAEKLKDLLGEDGCEIQKDRNGNAVVEPKTFEEVVDGIGSGKTAGLLEMQMIADALNCKLEIVDTVGDFAKNGSGSFEIDPEGKATGTIQVKYTANEDGTKHVTLIGPDGKEIEIPPAVDANGQPAPPNRCLYDAVAKSQNCSTDQLLNQVKTHATGNKMARYLYDEKVGEACPGLRVGNRTRKEGSKPAEIYLHRDEEGKVRTVAASVTKENIGGGSNVTNSMYKALNDAGRKGEPNPTTTDGNNTDQNDQQKYHAGHVIGFESGGKGGLKENNVVNMAPELNLGPYKELETEFRKLVEVSDGPVHINIDIDEDILSKDVDPLNPKHFRIRWSSDDGETIYRSPLLKNTKEGVQEYKDTPRAERDEYFQGDHYKDQRSQQNAVKNYPKPPEKPILVAQPGESPNDTIIRSIYSKGKKETEDTKFKGSLLRSNIKYPQPVNTTKSGTGKNTKPIGAASSTSDESLKATPQKRRDMQPEEDGVKRLQQ